MEAGGHISAFAYIMLVMSVPLCILAFATLRPPVAALTVFFGAALFLPERLAFDPPLIPSLDKHTLPAFTMFCCVLAVAPRRVADALPGRGVDRFMLMSVASAALTILTNQDALHFGPKTIPGQSFHDLGSFTLDTTMRIVIPFLLGRALFRNTSDAKTFVKAIVIAGLIYLPFVLYELKMSPQLHNWVYGYRQHSFLQTKRNDGWRPMCFMEHGLALTLFMAASALAAWTLVRGRIRVVRWLPPWLPAIILTGALPVMNSLGSLLYLLVGAPVILFLKPKGQTRFAVALGSLVAVYPMLRALHLFPTTGLVDLSARLSQDRADSLNFRFVNEDMLLDRLFDRPLFGWSGWSRGHVWTPEGKDITVVDGAWISILSARGFIGYAAAFGLLVAALVMARRSIERVPVEGRFLLAGLAMMSTFYTIDSLPNGWFNAIPVFLAGALAGLAQGMVKERTTTGFDPRAWLRGRLPALSVPAEAQPQPWKVERT